LILGSVLFSDLALLELAVHVSLVVFVLVHVDFRLNRGGAIVVLLILWWIHDAELMNTQ
jgi:hypothetical protein